MDSRHLCKAKVIDSKKWIEGFYVEHRKNMENGFSHVESLKLNRNDYIQRIWKKQKNLELNE